MGAPLRRTPMFRFSHAFCTRLPGGNLQIRAGYTRCISPKAVGEDSLREAMGRRRRGGCSRRPRGRQPLRLAPPRLPRQRGGRCRLAGVSEQDPPAWRPTPRGWGREKELSTANRGALLVPSAPRGGPLWGGALIGLRRYLCPGLPSASTGGPGGGRLPASEEPPGGEGGWPRPPLGLAGGTTSAPLRDWRGRDGRP